ncbi:MAG: hypothetical protein PHE53_06575 [Thermoguttaceae bacterium]|nr:hypothetical protein [Thermoguttaceae bacterium]
MTENQDAAWDIPDSESMEVTSGTNFAEGESTSKGRRTKKTSRSKANAESSKTAKSNDGDNFGKDDSDKDGSEGKRSRRKSTRRKTETVENAANAEDIEGGVKSAAKDARTSQSRVSKGAEISKEAISKEAGDEITSVKKTSKKKAGRKLANKGEFREQRRQDQRGKRSECGKSESLACGQNESALDDMATRNRESGVSKGISAFDAIFSTEPVMVDSKMESAESVDANGATNAPKGLDAAGALDAAALVCMTSDERRKTENVEAALLLNESPLNEFLPDELEDDESDSSEDSSDIGWNLDDSEDEELVRGLGFSEEVSSPGDSSSDSTEETDDSSEEVLDGTDVGSNDESEVDSEGLSEMDDSDTSEVSTCAADVPIAEKTDSDSSSKLNEVADNASSEASDESEDFLSLGWNPPVHQILPRKSSSSHESGVAEECAKKIESPEVTEATVNERSCKERKAQGGRSDVRDAKAPRDGHDRGRDKNRSELSEPMGRRAANDRRATKRADLDESLESPWDLSKLDEETKTTRVSRKGEASIPVPSATHAENVLSDLFELTPTVDSVFGAPAKREDVSAKQESSSAILDVNFESVESDSSDVVESSDIDMVESSDMAESSDTELPIPGAVRVKNASKGSRAASDWGTLVTELDVETDNGDTDVASRSESRHKPSREPRSGRRRDERSVTEPRSDRRRNERPATDERDLGKDEDVDASKPEHGIIPTWMDAISWLVRGNIDHRSNDRGQGDHRRGGKR